MEAISLALCVAGLMLGSIFTWLLCRKNKALAVALATESAKSISESEHTRLRTSLEATEKENSGLKAELSGRDARIFQLQDERAQEMSRRSALEEQAKRIPDFVQQVAQIERKLEAAYDKLLILETNKAELETSLKNEKAMAAEKLQLLDEAQAKLSDTFSALSANALRNSQQSFLDLAKTTLEKFQESARDDLYQRQQNIVDIVAPVKESLDKVDAKIHELEISRAGAYEGLKQQVMTLAETQQMLRAETSNLVKALRSPNARGRWGEIQLKRVVEMAGMVEHCDFCEQESVTMEEGRLRPDLTVKLPGGRTIVVDSKVPLDSYLDSIEAVDDEARKLKLIDHARQLRNHITALSRKSYWEMFQPSPEFVLLFLPSDAFYNAALEHDPKLIEDGVTEKVIIATPTTLIALLKAASYGWRQEMVAKNAQKVSDLGRELYDRLATMSEHLIKLGKSLGHSVEAYNKTVGSIETRVLVNARKFKELAVRGVSSSEIEELSPVDHTPRPITAPELLMPVVSERPIDSNVLQLTTTEN